MVYGEAWIEGTEFAIGDSEHMRKVILDTSKCNSEHEVWHGISRNRSIEWLKLVIDIGQWSTLVPGVSSRVNLGIP